MSERQTDADKDTLKNSERELPVMSEFSTSSMHSLIKSQGDKRVSKASANELGDILEKFAGDVAEEAIAIARDEGLDTVRDDHIRKALG